MEIQLTLEIHEEDGSVWAEVAELPGCFASGADLDELLVAMNEAVSLYLQDNPEAQETFLELARSRTGNVVDFNSRLPRKVSASRLKIDDVHATMQFDDLVEA